ncbi:MAG: FG-GAP-like repeat-containing protein [Acidobacteriota bacterium]|nr:FG-GAP-like repeat-containing protein [Acidobacteriota bacterium]
MKNAALRLVVFSGALAALAAGFAGQTHVDAQPAGLHFVAFGQGLPTSGQWREGFRIADLNEDGHLDIVHGAQRKQAGGPVIFLGDGKGNWSRWKQAQFPDLPYDYGDVEVADFNKDGHLDLAVAMHYRGIQVLLGNGHGVFSNASQGLDFDKDDAPDFTSRAIRAVDWNGDGRPDLVAVSEGPKMGGGGENGIFIYLNQGAKGWRRQEPALSPGIFSDSLALGDFDGDGHKDIATGSMVLGRKDLVNLWHPGAPTSLSVDIPGPRHYVHAVTAGDFDHDGKDDLAVAYVTLENEIWYSELDVFFARAGGKWERRVLSRQPNRDVAVALASGHLRGKDTLDLVGLTITGDTVVYLGDRQGKLTRDAGSIPKYDHGCRGAHLELADLDGDGRDEIVESFSDEPRNDGCGSGGGITAWKATEQEWRSK